MNKIIWIRRDRKDGKETEVTQNYVKDRIIHVYRDTRLAMSLANKDNPLTNGFADYYPVTK